MIKIFSVMLLLFFFGEVSGLVMASDANESSDFSMDAALFQNTVMTKEGTGTGWQPELSPMHAFGYNLNSWNMMMHFNCFTRYLGTDIGGSGNMGANGFSYPNWLMLMAYKDFKTDGKIMFRTMLSLDRLTDGGNGYPNMFQSGETWQGELITNRQHPHDLVSELSAGYSRSFGVNTGAFSYIAYPGEPALGPVAYMHRASARNISSAPLTHHWLDSTHISFGVMTLGFWLNPFKFDASVFNGNEPDENRYEFDNHELNSASMRITTNPTKETSMQVSYASINAEDQSDKMSKVTASIMQSIPIYDYIDWDNVNWDITGAWGLNTRSAGPTNALLFESNFQANKNSMYLRLEMVEKTPEELAILNNGIYDQNYSVTAVTIGFARDIAGILEHAYSGIMFSLGAQATLHSFSNDLKPLYGDSPVSAEVYLKISPKLMQMKGH